MYQTQRVSGRFGCVLTCVSFDKLIPLSECGYFSFKSLLGGKVSFSLQVVYVFINGVLMFLSTGLKAVLIRIPGHSVKNGAKFCANLGPF